jgi:lysine 6-dehydrogenase
MTIAVLGAGMVGRAIALDLARHHQVHSFDVSTANLAELNQRNPSIQTTVADLSAHDQYMRMLADFDLVVTAVPGFMGYATLEAAIRAGKNIVDISFFPEDSLQLDKLAKEMNVTVITDCGVAPGMSNLILGRYNEEMKISSFTCYVGGLPVERKPPFQYKAPFSPVDVIQEYIRPARLVENGVIVTRPALSEREILLFGAAGELEAFNTDGLRSLVDTMGHIPNMKEKTLRYPGHIDLIIFMQQAGFFETTPVLVEGQPVVPLEFTSKLLVDQWKLGPDEKEFTVMTVALEGEKNGRKEKIGYSLLDYYDPATRTSSMARTTGYTCTAAVELVLKNMFTENGVFPPEFVGKHKDCFEFVLKHLRERGVNWEMTSVSLPA